ncbi:MAG TPA: efflux RND transporter periplasmic adaptor subunit [Polyangiaceae bacterium]|nr:efflux RND transporter periplasmic adaptor subunit [Polyangiaceae bacterium]
MSCNRVKQEMQEGSKEQVSEHGERSAPQTERDELPLRVHLSDEVIASAGIQTAPATREVLAAVLALPGEIAADPDKSAQVAPPIAGRIERVDFKEGSAVKKGDTLAVIRIPELGKLRAGYATANAQAKAARSNADRLKSLADKRMASEQEVINAEAEAVAFEVEAQGNAEQLAALGGGGASTLVLRAPVSGVVLSRNAVVGQPVTAEQTIATIADLSELWFLARVFEKDLGAIRLGATAEVELNAYPAERFEGSVEFVGKQVDPVARTVTARIRLSNRDDMLRINLFGTASIAVAQSSKKAATVVVSRNAVSEVGGQQVVFVREAGGDFEQHKVLLGAGALGKIEVLAGLREGEQVVVEGVFTLKSAILKSTFAEEE